MFSSFGANSTLNWSEIDHVCRSEKKGEIIRNCYVRISIMERARDCGARPGDEMFRIYGRNDTQNERLLRRGRPAQKVMQTRCCLSDDSMPTCCRAGVSMSLCPVPSGVRGTEGFRVFTGPCYREVTRSSDPSHWTLNRTFEITCSSMFASRLKPYFIFGQISTSFVRN